MNTHDTLIGNPASQVAESVSDHDQTKQHLTNAPVAQAETLRDSVFHSTEQLFCSPRWPVSHRCL